MTKTRPWSTIRDEIRADPERAARIDAIKREMDRAIEAANRSVPGRPPRRTGSAIAAKVRRYYDVRRARTARLHERRSGKPRAVPERDPVYP